MFSFINENIPEAKNLLPAWESIEELMQILRTAKEHADYHRGRYVNRRYVSASGQEMTATWRECYAALVIYSERDKLAEDKVWRKLSARAVEAKNSLNRGNKSKYRPLKEKELQNIVQYLTYHNDKDAAEKAKKDLSLY